MVLLITAPCISNIIGEAEPMQVVHLNPNAHNFISGQNNYFIYQTSEGKKLLLNAACPHRGGPLYLGNRNCSSEKLICPWHNQKQSEQSLQRHALPMIHVPGRATALIKESPEIHISVSKITILANLS